MAISEPQPRDRLKAADALAYIRDTLRYNISKSTFRRWARRGVVPSIQPFGKGGQRLFDPADLERLVRKMRT